MQNDYLDEFFTLLVKGAIQWYRRQCFTIPTQITSAKSTYIEEVDIVNQFVKEECKTEGKIKRSLLYNCFKAWCTENGEAYLPGASMYARLSKLGFSQSKIKGTRYVLGLELNEEESDIEFIQ